MPISITSWVVSSSKLKVVGVFGRSFPKFSFIEKLHGKNRQESQTKRENVLNNVFRKNLFYVFQFSTRLDLTVKNKIEFFVIDSLL